MLLKQLITATLVMLAVSVNGAATPVPDTAAATAAPAAAPTRIMLQPPEQPEYLAKPPDGAVRDRFIPAQDRSWYLQAIENLAIGAATNTEHKQSDGRPRTPTTPRP